MKQSKRLSYEEYITKNIIRIDSVYYFADEIKRNFTKTNFIIEKTSFVQLYPLIRCKRGDGRLNDYDKTNFIVDLYIVPVTEYNRNFLSTIHTSMYCMSYLEYVNGKIVYIQH